MGIFFDSRKDKTEKFEWSEVSNSFHRFTIREDHYSMSAEPGGRYVDHFVLDTKTSEITHAKQVAIYICKWVMENEYENDVVAIGGDTTNANTGAKGGVMQFVEEILGKKLIWITCNLHINELPLKKLIKDKVGDAQSDSGYKGIMEISLNM